MTIAQPTLTLTAGNVTITRTCDDRFNRRRYTTTITRDGERVGFVEHGAQLWASVVLDQTPTLGRMGRQAYQMWPGRGNFVCGEYPAEMATQVREMVAAMRAQELARKDREYAAMATPALQLVNVGGLYTVALSVLANHREGRLLPPMPHAWATRAMQLLSDQCTAGDMDAEVARIAARMSA